MKKPSVREILFATIKELLAEKEPEEITVREILEMSGISRPTFYKHFYDKIHLIECVFEEELAKPYFWDFSKGLVERERDFLKYLGEHRAFYLHALNIQGQNSIYHLWLKQATNSLFDFFRSKPENADINDDELLFASRYLAFSWVNMNIEWLRGEQCESAELMAQRLGCMMTEGLDGFRRKKEE